MTPYERAQHAVAQLKGAVYELLDSTAAEGLRNSEIGRALGIYMGHQGHQGHVSRTILAMMELEGVVVQDADTKRWQIMNRIDQTGDDS